jgi:hypothetical protein
LTGSEKIHREISWAQDYIDSKFQKKVHGGYEIDLIFPHLLSSLLKLKSVTNNNKFYQDVDFKMSLEDDFAIFGSILKIFHKMNRRDKLKDLGERFSILNF